MLRLLTKNGPLGPPDHWGKSDRATKLAEAGAGSWLAAGWLLAGAGRAHNPATASH